MAKKTKQRGDAAAAREASDPEGMTAAAAGSGASKKSRRRGDAAEVEKETAASLADSAIEWTPEKKHKIKKPKKSKQQQTEAVYGIGFIDSPDVKIVEESMNAKEGNNDDSQNCSSVQENSVGRKKKMRRNKQKSNNSNTDTDTVQNCSLQSDAGEAALVTAADENSNPAVNIAEDSMNGEQGNKDDSQNYSSLQENSAGRKKERRRKTQKINNSNTDSSTVRNSSLRPDAAEAALVTTADENSIPVLNIAEDSMNGKQGNKDDSQNYSSLQENSVGRKKKMRRKKQKKINSNTDADTVQNCSLQPDAGEAALVTAADENSIPDVNIAEDSMNGEQGNKDDPQNYSSLQENSAGRKKERKRKNQKINNSNTDSSTVQNSSLRPDAGEAALVTTAESNIPVVNIAEDPMNGKQGNKDDSQNYSSLQNSVRSKKKKKRKNQKENNSNTDASTVQNSTLHPDAGEAALVTTADENSIPDVNIAEDSMNGEQGNKDDPQNYSSLQENSAGRKKERKRKNQKINNSNTDSSTVQNSSLRPDAGEAALVTTADESNIPVVNIAEDPMNGKQGNKDDSQNYSSLQNSVRSKKKKKRKNQKENNSNTDASTVQSSPLQPDAGEAALVTTADENITPYISIAEDSMNGKQDSKDDSQHHSSSQENSVQRKIKPRRKKQSINNINTDRNSVQNSPLQPDAGEAALETAGENSIECSKSTESNKSIKINQDGVTAKAKINVLHEKLVACESTAHDTACTGPLSLDQVHKHKEAYSLGGSMIRFRKKKLLILDLNGLLADINQDHHNAHMSHAKVRGKLVFKRPYYEDFLKFCFQNFELGVWSSRMKYNVETVVNVLMKDLKKYLLFCWDLSYCTPTGCNTLENQHKPLVLKELKKLWNKEVPDLPWEQGEFSPSNSLLVDDSPYKALRNPLHTAIFPHPYSYHNEKDDDSLGPGGDLRVYLKNLAAADDVQHYVREHPFGQPAIVETDPHWNFYLRILDKLEKPVA